MKIKIAQAEACATGSRQTLRSAMNTENHNAIEVTKLRKAFGDFVAVKEVSFAVHTGEIFGLLGPNGAGKTTLIRMMTTLTPPTSGRAVVGGHDVVSDADGVRHAIGVIPQALTSDPELTARENMAIHAKLYGLTSAQRQELIPSATRIRGAHRILRTNWWEVFREECAGAWKSRAAWCIRRRFCFSTSRPRASIRFRAPPSGK